MKSINDLEFWKFKWNDWEVYLETTEGKPPFSNDLKWLTINDLNMWKFTGDWKIRIKITY
jgi:hypothetical protein